MTPAQAALQSLDNALTAMGASSSGGPRQRICACLLKHRGWLQSKNIPSLRGAVVCEWDNNGKRVAYFSREDVLVYTGTVRNEILRWALLNYRLGAELLIFFNVADGVMVPVVIDVLL
jgi:hypothetical protein